MHNRGPSGIAGDSGGDPVIHELWHLMPYIIFGASMGSSAVHFLRRQFPRSEEPPPFPKAPSHRQIGEDPAIRILESYGRLHVSLMSRHRATTRPESLILTTMVAAVSISAIVQILRGRK
jgi:hypothetical protein